VLADAAFFLSHTAPVNNVAFGWLGSGDAANSGHKFTPEKSEEHETRLRAGQEGNFPRQNDVA
jgi:hypothetical protein